MTALQMRELQAMSATELRDQHATCVKELVHLRVRATAVGVERPAEFRRLRRDIARILTVVREKAAT